MVLLRLLRYEQSVLVLSFRLSLIALHRYKGLNPAFIISLVKTSSVLDNSLAYLQFS